MNFSNYPSANELLNNIIEKNKNILDNIFERIISAHEFNERRTNYVYEDYEHFPNEEFIYDILEKKGYKISWNSACLWYEISW